MFILVETRIVINKTTRKSEYQKNARMLNWISEIDSLFFGPIRCNDVLIEEEITKGIGGTGNNSIDQI